MLTSSEDEAHVLAALRAGARGYVVKGVTGRELRGIVRAVHRGEVFVSPSLAAGVHSEMASESAKTPVSLLDDLQQFRDFLRIPFFSRNPRVIRVETNSGPPG